MTRKETRFRMDILPNPRPGPEQRALELLEIARFSMSKQDVISTEITIRKLEYDLAREIEMKKRVEAYREKQREKNKGDNEGASKQDDPGNDSASTGTSQVDEDDEELQRFLLEYDRKTFEDYDRESVLEILARAAAFCTVRMRQLPSE